MSERVLCTSFACWNIFLGEHLICQLVLLFRTSMMGGFASWSRGSDPAIDLFFSICLPRGLLPVLGPAERYMAVQFQPQGPASSNHTSAKYVPYPHKMGSRKLGMLGSCSDFSVTFIFWSSIIQRGSFFELSWLGLLHAYLELFILPWIFSFANWPNFILKPFYLKGE